jgi:hypothetical protein
LGEEVFALPTHCHLDRSEAEWRDLRFLFSTPHLGQPRRVRLLDKPDLLSASPMLDLFFTLDRVVDVSITLIPNETMASVISRETRHFGFPMFLRASQHTVGDSDIKDVRPARDYINIVAMFFHQSALFRGLRAK